MPMCNNYATPIADEGKSNQFALSMSSKIT